MAYAWKVAALLALVIGCAAQQARLLVHKTLTQSALIQNMNTTIYYTIINNGDVAASDIMVHDRYDFTAFAPVVGASPDGMITHFIPELAPGAKHTITQDIVTTLNTGSYMLPRAMVTYSFTGADGEIVEHKSHSTALRATVLTHKQFLLESSQGGQEWLVVFAAYAVSGLAPLYFWLNTRVASEKGQGKKKSS